MSQTPQGQELEWHEPQQHSPAADSHSSQQLGGVCLPRLPSWPAEPNSTVSPATDWPNKDGKQVVVHAGVAALEFRDISYWLPARPPSLRQRLAQLSSTAQDNSAGSSRSSLGLDQHAPGLQRERLGKQLLMAVSGAAHAGRLLAVMGPSGAGKTTLLSILAGDRDVLAPSAGTIAGTVLLRGKQRQLAAFRRSTAHVTQDDVLLPTTTPREALAFTAALRLPGRGAAARQARAAAVQGMLAGMALAHCADTLVGRLLHMAGAGAG